MHVSAVSAHGLLVIGKLLHRAHTAHTNNIFSVGEVQGTDRNIIVSCAADGKVIKNVIDRRSSTTLFTHNGRAHRLSLNPNDPHQFTSCGADGLACLFDLRQSYQPVQMIHIKDENDESMALYSISINPMHSEQFCVAGSSNRVFLHDVRYSGTAFAYMCPQHLLDSRTHITSAKFNYAGNSLIASYSDENIYSFNVPDHSRIMNSADATLGYMTAYKGHRNVQTVKQVNYMGARDEYVVSGSDCGHVFIWRKDGLLVNVAKGDDIGVVNCLTPHAFLPLLATSGLDSAGKLWSVRDLGVGVPRAEMNMIAARNIRGGGRGNTGEVRTTAGLMMSMFDLEPGTMTALHLDGLREYLTSVYGSMFVVGDEDDDEQDEYDDEEEEEEEEDEEDDMDESLGESDGSGDEEEEKEGSHYDDGDDDAVFSSDRADDSIDEASSTGEDNSAGLTTDGIDRPYAHKCARSISAEDDEVSV